MISKLKPNIPILVFICSSLLLILLDKHSRTQISYGRLKIGKMESKEEFIKDARIEVRNLSSMQSYPETVLNGSYLLNVPEDLELKEEITYKVPKTLHFLWFGNLMDEKNQTNILSFRRNNPEYEIFLYTEIITDELKNNLTGINIVDINSEIQNYRIRDLFDAEVDFRRKSDILRYEIIYQNGGVYFDTDTIRLEKYFSVA
ncbi:uncharacterized protein LOC111705048 [Eurytemora carolleeae]|uniref:uncharacterized protein LOC111705048 n=1 Tax=Eurytemora carolleeae TaxID=1294199 RepID=UPI000C767EB8|nr:uncharacterized protein LOC111705048 [Eurytemora carolleeae]|eukprot:XP_023333244.1 uncharacterized protein LOC111705048 [Eurytemora affinis]